jgi:hypothetical protein
MQNRHTTPSTGRSLGARLQAEMRASTKRTAFSLSRLENEPVFDILRMRHDANIGY